MREPVGVHFADLVAELAITSPFTEMEDWRRDRVDLGYSLLLRTIAEALGFLSCEDEETRSRALLPTRKASVGSDAR